MLFFPALVQLLAESAGLGPVGFGKTASEALCAGMSVLLWGNVVHVHTSIEEGREPIKQKVSA